MIRQIIDIQGKRFVLVEESALLHLERQASKAESRLPAYPPADEKGNRPALDYIRVSIARDIIKERQALGMTQNNWLNLLDFGRKRSADWNRASTLRQFVPSKKSTEP